MNKLFAISTLFFLISCSLKPLDFSKHKEYDAHLIGTWNKADSTDNSSIFQKIELGENGYFDFTLSNPANAVFVDKEWYTEDNKILNLIFESLQQGSVNNYSRTVYDYTINNDTLILDDGVSTAVPFLREK